MSNFYSALATSASREEVAGLYGAMGWLVRRCGWTEMEVRCAWAELVIESESPILMHGFVQDVAERADELLAPLRAARIPFTAECYDDEMELLRELTAPDPSDSPPTE